MSRLAKSLPSRMCVLVAFTASLSFARLAGGQVNSWYAVSGLGFYDSGQYDTINLQNLNVSVSIPFMSKSGALPIFKRYARHTSVFCRAHN